MEWSLERSPFPDGLQPVPALRAAAAPFPCHSCQGLQKALNPRAEQQNERLMKNLKVRQNRNEGLKEKTNKNTSTKIPLVPAAPCSPVLPSKALLICGGFAGFPQPLVPLSDGHIPNVACPHLRWDVISLTGTFLLRTGLSADQLSFLEVGRTAAAVFLSGRVSAFAHGLQGSCFH